MRVVCWNIERGYRPSEIVDMLRTLDADIYLLYELDRGVKRTKGVDMFQLIGDGLGLTGKYIREFYEIESVWRKIIPWGGPGGGEIGNAIFSKYPIKNYSVIDLPLKGPLYYRRSTVVPELFQPRKGCRKAQLFTVTVDGHDLDIVSAHLELWRSNWEHRKQQLEAALQDTSSSRHLLLAGDFNSVQGAVKATFGFPRQGEVAQLRQWLAAKQLQDPFADWQTTSGRLGIRAKLDWMAASADLQVSAAKLQTTDLSDHACLVVDYISS